MVRTPTGFRRYLTANSTRNASLLAEGMQAKPTAADLPMFPLHGAMSAILEFSGSHAAPADKTNDYRIWGANYRFSPAGKITGLISLHCICTVATILGTKTGISGDEALTNAENMAKTIVPTITDATTTTPHGPGADSDAAFADGTIVAYSPGDAAGQAQLFMGNLCRYDGLIIERVGGTADSGNAHIKACMV